MRGGGLAPRRVKLAKLRGNPSFIFTLIQKFNRPDAEPLYPDHDIVLMSDEAHRTQNGVLAENMTRMLHGVVTGTPLFANDNITERTFGGYVSIYDFQRAGDFRWILCWARTARKNCRRLR